MSATAFGRRLATIAEEQHAAYYQLAEADPVLCRQIERYWTELGLAFSDCITKPWSAVFVSWCVMKAGATAAEFPFAPMHSMFVHAAIENARIRAGSFHGVEITAQRPEVGDILQSNREGTTYDYLYAAAHNTYPSHSAIVVEIGEDETGRYALTVGGNEGNTIRKTFVRLTPDGFVKQRTANPFICLVKSLK